MQGTKKIRAIIRRDRLKDATLALEAIGITDVEITNVRSGVHQDISPAYRRMNSPFLDMLSYAQISVVLNGTSVNQTLQALQKTAYTGERDLVFIYLTESSPL